MDVKRRLRLADRVDLRSVCILVSQALWCVGLDPFSEGPCLGEMLELRVAVALGVALSRDINEEVYEKSQSLE